VSGRDAHTRGRAKAPADQQHPRRPSLVNAAVSYLEQRCRDGCLTNVLPQALRDQRVVTDAGAPLPPREHRNEEPIFRPRPGRRRGPTSFARVRRSRAGGLAGPVLYVDADIETFTALTRT